jgi:hypothetical protein
MKWSAAQFLLIIGVLIAGCASHKPKAAAPARAASPLIVTPDMSLTAKVVVYNDVGRYAVLSFPIGRMPAVGQTLFLYRNGLKVAEVKTSNWQRDNYVVADLVTGDAQVGDEVRSQ